MGIAIRECTKEYKIRNSHIIIEKGVKIVIPTSGLHYDAKFYDQPDKFMPERFSEEQCADKTFLDMPYMPFGTNSIFMSSLIMIHYITI